MKIDKETFKHLSGTEFSSSFKFKISERFTEKRRIDLLTSICRNKKIIHLGCLDHIPLIKDKIKEKTWLHGLLTEVSDICLGIDINKEGIDYVRNELHFENIIYGDIINDETPKIQELEKWDYLILGEILEHIDDPVSFLNNIRRKYDKKIDQIVITVPNVLNLGNAKSLKQNIENINSDHRYWFSPFTILKVVHRAGFTIESYEFANRIPLNKWKLIIRKIRILLGTEKKYPFSYFSTIVVTASF